MKIFKPKIIIPNKFSTYTEAKVVFRTPSIIMPIHYSSKDDYNMSVNLAIFELKLKLIEEIVKCKIEYDTE